MEGRLGTSRYFTSHIEVKDTFLFFFPTHLRAVGKSRRNSRPDEINLERLELDLSHKIFIYVDDARIQTEPSLESEETSMFCSAIWANGHIARLRTQHPEI